MNALNLLSARLIGPTPANVPSSLPPDARRDLAKSGSWFWVQQRRRRSTEARKDKDGAPTRPGRKASQDDKETAKEDSTDKAEAPTPLPDYDEKSLSTTREEEVRHDEATSHTPITRRWASIPRQVAGALVASIRWIFTTLAAPGVFLIACLTDEQGRFSPLRPARQVYHFAVRPWRAQATTQAIGLSAASDPDDGEIRKKAEKRMQFSRLKSYSAGEGGSADSSLAMTPVHRRGQKHLSIDDGEEDDQDGSGRRAPSKSASSADTDESTHERRNIRIQASKEDARKRRKSRKTDSTGSRATETSDSVWLEPTSLTPATLKSPTSPLSSLGMTKYPRAPAPPRPLIPRRRSSTYIAKTISPEIPSKTLILDLDETLIHSLAKGGRMGTGHMVEVRLNTTVGLGGGGATIGPQHPILYYVHKRPHCDEFLRKICKWYKLVIFTASVQEYADPVIDWLEQDRKYFIGRYYRQHCTFRSGNYIKDLSSVEPDLSKVMIVDNSPASYVFHPDNAIPIEGWINDPTDNHLLHLIPLLEGLQYVTDVRALLGLRMGEPTSLSSIPA